MISCFSQIFLLSSYHLGALHSCRALEFKMSILQANINGWLINQENELLVRAQLVKFLDICKLDGVWGTVWFFTVLPWKSGLYSSAERILSDLFPATPAACSTNEKTLYCCKSNKSHIWYSGAVPPALCSNHWVCKLKLPLLDSGGRNPPMHLCDSPPDTVGVKNVASQTFKKRCTIRSLIATKKVLESEQQMCREHTCMYTIAVN